MKPEIHKSSFIHETAVIVGNVKIGKNCGVFPYAVIRGDENSIEIGDGSNVQDCCVLHVDEDHKIKIGKNVTIGHSAMIHGATIEDECLIGIHATALNGAIIGSGSIIGANALVTAYMKIPEKPGLGVELDFDPSKVNVEGNPNHFDNLAALLPDEILDPIGLEMYIFQILYQK